MTGYVRFSYWFENDEEFINWSNVRRRQLFFILRSDLHQQNPIQTGNPDPIILI